MAMSRPPKFEGASIFAGDLRFNLGKTQQEIANLTGKPRSNISKYENGSMTPPAGYLARLICLNVEGLRDIQTIEGYKEASLQEMNHALREYPKISLLREWGELERLADDYRNEPNDQHNADASSPYLGLSAFTQEDAHLFFGRDTFTQKLLRAIESRGLVTVLGPSGIGKSSIVFAGLVPALLERSNEKWLFATFRPTEDPFLGAANALIPLLEPDLGKTKQIAEAGNLADHLRERPTALTEYLLSIHQVYADHRLLIIVDQFEELYTLDRNSNVRQQFLDALLGAAEATQGASPRLVLTLRSDFLSLAQSYPRLNNALQDTMVLLGPMARDELKEAIEKPAEHHNVSFEAKLVDRILDDVGQEEGSLPLLEFALTELWQHQRQRTLTHVAYEEIGQIKGALSGYADNVYQTLNVAEQEQARRLFVQLVNPGVGTEDTRRQAIRTELEVEWPLVTKLATKRLVVTDQEANTHEPETVEMVHEALIRHWGQLKNWMDDVRTFRAWQERLRSALDRWQESEQNEGLLLQRAYLSEAERWLAEREDELGPAEHDFIQESIGLRAREQRREKMAWYFRWGTVAISIILLGVLLWLGGALVRPWWLTQCLPECPNANLSRLDLSGANLSKANLIGADLSDTVLNSADLSEAHLNGANLSDTVLNRADLRNGH